jgi:tetratricopeptide (TPR) repeat protein
MAMNTGASYKFGKVVTISALVLCLSSSPVLLPDSLNGDAFAQESGEEKKVNKKRPRSGKKSYALGKKVYEIITKANEFVDADQTSAALKELDKTKSMEKLSAYETAQIYSFYGYLYFNAERYSDAIDSYNKVLQQPDLPPAVQQQSIRTLAQLAFVTEDYDAAIRYANQYLNDVGPDADMYVVLGTAYYQKDEYANIIPPVEKAIKMTQELGNKTKENWWLLLRVAYWEQENYTKVKQILETLVVNWPKKEYWIQLSGVYSELKDEVRQLASFEAAYDQGMLVSSSELIQMAQLFMQAEVPYKGAKILEAGLASGSIEKTTKNVRLLAQAWQMSQEDLKAIPPLKQAAGMSGDGELFARLATSYLNLNQYVNCIDASNKAINKGGLKNKGSAYLILGMCQFESKSLNSAKTSFQNAARYDKTKKNAGSWVAHVNSEQARLRQLEQALQRANKDLGIETKTDAETKNDAADQPQVENT